MSSSSTIEKPSVDKREYRHFQIGKKDGDGALLSSPSNTMDVLLISDPETDKAAAALDVYVGQLCDGDDPGIAHFLEHMIFMGNERYKDINEVSTRVLCVCVDGKLPMKETRIFSPSIAFSSRSNVFF